MATKTSDKKSKYVGVYLNKPTKKWMAYITVNGKNKYVGLFQTEEEANEANLQARKKHSVIRESIYTLIFPLVYQSFGETQSEQKTEIYTDAILNIISKR